MLARVGFCGPGTYCFFWASHGCQKSQIRHTQDAMLCAAADKFVIVSNRQLGGQQAFRKLRGLERTRSPVECFGFGCGSSTTATAALVEGLLHCCERALRAEALHKVGTGQGTVLLSGIGA